MLNHVTMDCPTEQRFLVVELDKSTFLIQILYPKGGCSLTLFSRTSVGHVMRMLSTLAPPIDNLE